MGLRAVPCDGRKFAAFHTHDALEIMRERHAAELTPNGFVVKLVQDAAYRRSIIESMSTDAVAFAYPMTVIR